VHPFPPAHTEKNNAPHENSLAARPLLPAKKTTLRLPVITEVTHINNECTLTTYSIHRDYHKSLHKQNSCPK
jgi:hypothetical protein